MPQLVSNAEQCSSTAIPGGTYQDMKVLGPSKRLISLTYNAKLVKVSQLRKHFSGIASKIIYDQTFEK